MKKNWRRGLSLVMGAVMAASLAACAAPATEVTPTPQPIETAAPTEAPAALFTPGTYTGVGTGMGGEVRVEVVLSADRIESVTVGENNETAGISHPAKERIPAAIVEAQGLKIDAVTGATMTSNAILAAVEDAIAQAGGDVERLKQRGLDAVAAEDETIETDVVVVGSGIARPGCRH